MSGDRGTPIIVAILSGEIMELKQRLLAISKAHATAKSDGKWDEHLTPAIMAASQLLSTDKNELLV